MRYDELLNSKDIDQTAISYMNSIRSYTALKKEEEHKLIIDYKKKHDINARNKLLKSNLKYTCKIASEFRNRGVPFSHLISEANDALLYALDKYDEKKNTKLISYAKWWIWQRVDALVKNPDFVFEDLPTERDEQIDDNSDYVEEQKIGDDYNNAAFCNEENEQSEQNELLDMLYENLNNRESDCLNMHYGRYPYEKEYTLEEIGEKYKISKERARQIINKSLTKLRSEALLLETKTV